MYRAAIRRGSTTMHAIAGVDLGREPVQINSTQCYFQHLLPARDLRTVIFREVAPQLAR